MRVQRFRLEPRHTSGEAVHDVHPVGCGFFVRHNHRTNPLQKELRIVPHCYFVIENMRVFLVFELHLFQDECASEKSVYIQRVHAAVRGSIPYAPIERRLIQLAQPKQCAPSLCYG